MINKLSDQNTTLKIVWRALTPKERRHLVGIWVLILLGMVLETFSLGIIVPFIGLFSQSNFRSDIPLVGHYFAGISLERTLVISMAGFSFIYVAKNVFLYFSAFIQRRFSFAISRRLSQETFEIYLRQPYEFHLEHNSATLIRNVETAGSIVGSGLDPLLVILTDGLVAIGLFTLLLKIEPMGTLAVLAIFCTSALLFQRATNTRINQWGAERKFHAAKILQHLQQGLNGAKEIKIFGREMKFIDLLGEHLSVRMDIERRYALLQTLPRLFFEAIAIIGLAVLVVMMVLSGTAIKEILPTLGLFAATAFRVMPSIGRLIASFQAISYGKVFIQTTDQDMRLPKTTRSESFEPTHLRNGVCLRRVSFRYKNSNNLALDEVSIEVLRGEAVGIIGSSGAGKSTLVDVLLGLLTPSSGSIEIDGLSITSNVQGWQRLIGYVPQSIYLIDDTIRKNIAFGVPERDIDNFAVQRALHAAQLDDFVMSLPDGIDTIVGERGVRLSGGQRQRIGIARALYHDPEVLVLDEATSSLDAETERGVMDAVRDLLGSKTIVIIAHRVSTVSYCSRVYRMEQGRVVGVGSPEMMTGLKESPKS